MADDNDVSLSKTLTGSFRFDVPLRTDWTKFTLNVIPAILASLGASLLADAGWKSTLGQACIVAGTAIVHYMKDARSKR